MSDYLTSLLEVPRKFTKDSQQLLQRCTKPDKRGTLLDRVINYKHLMLRVCQDCPGGGDGSCVDGLYWILYQACPHSHQQYHSVCLSGPVLFTNPCRGAS